MKCPHCQESFHSNPHTDVVGYDESVLCKLFTETCPACKQIIIEAVKYNRLSDNYGNVKLGSEVAKFFIHPKGATRPNPSNHVPQELAKYYIEAALVLSDSAMASAALSRRCLQHLIRDTVGITDKDLAPAIDKLLAQNVLPSHLSEAIDAIRNIGNFAAHPMKSTSTGQILEVEYGEAEWNLDVLDGLFDFYFVQPAITQAKKASLNAKLLSAGKPSIK